MVVSQALTLTALLGCGAPLRAELTKWQWGFYLLVLGASAIGNTVNQVRRILLLLRRSTDRAD